MTVFDLSPGFVKILYVRDTIQHVQTIPVAPSGDIVVGEEPSFFRNVNPPDLMGVCVDELIALYKPIFGADVDISSAEFWSKPEPEDDPFWVFTHDVGEVGTAGSASAPFLQSTMTLRTASGHHYKNVLVAISSVFPNDLRTFWPFSAGVFKNLADYLIGDDSWIVGRDGANLVVPTTFTTKTNDAVRKKVLGL